jgi:hypothetical protein
LTNHQIAYECARSIDLARLGYLLANGLLDRQAAADVIYEVQPIVGWYPLEDIGIDAVVEAAGYRWSNPAEQILPLAEQACQRVWNKWESSGDVSSAAEDWALNLIAEYAPDAGVELVEGERDGIEDEEAQH